MKGYQPRKDISSRYIGGVVATWISNKLIAQRRRDLESPDIEGLWLEIRSNNSKFLTCTIYRPPNTGAMFRENVNEMLGNVK